MIFGIICIGYYLAVCRYIGHWESKFPRFWLALGAASCLLSWQAERIPEGIRCGLRLTGGLVLVAFIVVEICILAGIRNGDGMEEAEYIIVLGAKVDGFHLTDALKQRLDRALAYLKEHEKTKVVVSGGQGPGEQVSEACAMAEYLKKCGIAESRILKEDRSTTTRENLIFSGMLIKDGQEREALDKIKAGIVTNNFHIYRAVCIAKQVGYHNVIPLPAPTTPIMFVNYMTREFFGVLKMWAERKKIKVD